MKEASEMKYGDQVEGERSRCSFHGTALSGPQLIFALPLFQVKRGMTSSGS